MQEKQKRPDKRTHIYLPHEEDEVYRKMAQEEGRSFSEVVRRALRLYADMREVRNSGNPVQTFKAIRKRGLL